MKVKRVLRVKAGGSNLRRRMILGRKAEKKKGDNVRENSLVKKNV